MSAVWDFRANEDYYTSEELTKWLTANCKTWVFQKEQGDKGYIHWQGRFSLIKKRMKNVLMKLFKDKIPNYLEPTSKQNHLDEFFYAMKEDTRLDGPWYDKSHQSTDIYVPKQYRNIVLYDWQQQIVDSHKVFEPRKINVIFDGPGNKGKSTLAAIAEITMGAIDMPPLNDYKELVQLACNIFMDQNIRDSRLMFFDMPRSLPKEKLGGLFAAIEQIKKGKFYDIRHHYKQWWADSPTVWVFTNVLPDFATLSLDRWNIWEIKENKLVPYNLGKPDSALDV